MLKSCISAVCFISAFAFTAFAQAAKLNPYSALEVELDKKVNHFKSKNGNDYTFWVKNIQWDVRHASDAIKDKALRKLRRFLEQQQLFPVRRLYSSSS